MNVQILLKMKLFVTAKRKERMAAGIIGISKYSTKIYRAARSMNVPAVPTMQYFKRGLKSLSIFLIIKVDVILAHAEEDLQMASEK